MVSVASRRVTSVYFNKLRERGMSAIVRDRLRWYRLRLALDNWFVGRAVELTGNRVRMSGLKFSVANPLVSTRHKSTLFFGIYEMDEIELVRRYLDRGLPVVELGGSIGVVACTTNRLLRNPDRHIVVEASPILLPTLLANRNSNGCGFTVVHAAVAYNTNAVQFPVEGHFLHGRLGSSEKSVRVPAISLGQLLERFDFETIDLVADIEGSEIDLVEHEPNVLRTHVKTLIMETHACYRGEDRVRGMLAALTRLGFERITTPDARDGAVVAMVNRNL